MRGTQTRWSWLVAAGLIACAPHTHAPRVPEVSTSAGGAPEAALKPLPPPPMADGVYPCSDCHANLETDFTRRALEQHDITLDHGDRERWCFDCHDTGDRDQVRLASGALVPLTESQKLCGQCHGDKYRDWRLGVHGKRMGDWNGAREYLVCVACHDPHSPKFRPLAPMPPPVRPDRLAKHAVQP